MKSIITAMGNEALNNELKKYLSYKNFNICKLIREDKVKLQYSENLNEYKRKYKKCRCKHKSFSI